MQELVAFTAALIAFRLAGLLVARWRVRRAQAVTFWAVALASYAVACAGLAWGAAAGWDGRVFRVYYLFGGLLTAPFLGAGSLALVGRRASISKVMYVYTAISVAVVASVHLKHGVHGSAIPSAQKTLDFFPARLLALIGNSLGTLAVVAVALRTIRRRPVGNALVVAGVAVAATGSALTGLGEGGTAALFAVAALLLYAGFVAPRSLRLPQTSLTLRGRSRLTP